MKFMLSAELTVMLGSSTVKLQDPPFWQGLVLAQGSGKVQVKVPSPLFPQVADPEHGLEEHGSSTVPQSAPINPDVQAQSAPLAPFEQVAPFKHPPLLVEQ